MKRLLKTIFGRLTVVLAAIFLQVWLFVYIIFELGAEYRYVDLGIKLLAVIFVFWILNNWMNPAYKLLWSILILAVPVVGVVLYYIMGQSRVTRQVRRRYESAVELCKPLMQQKEAVAVSLRKADEDAYRQSSYLSGDSGFPAYHNTKTVFFPTGEEMYARMKEELEKAKHFIFIEYFIVAEGEMWDGILEILEKKVREGVDVRLIYDDIGSIGTLPMGYFKKMRALGIKCVVFNRFVPAASIFLNNRDHRKILVQPDRPVRILERQRHHAARRRCIFIHCDVPSDVERHHKIRPGAEGSGAVCGRPGQSDGEAGTVQLQVVPQGAV